jgi:NTP pyrophosphatase (non-canonical NTP hydrolase)
MENNNPQEKKSLRLEPVNLKVDRRILVDSFNLNGFQWTMQKSVEESIELCDALIHFQKNDITDAEVCQEIADVYIQCAILLETFGSANVQSFINKKLKSIRNRNERLTKKVSTGFII